MRRSPTWPARVAAFLLTTASCGGDNATVRRSLEPGAPHGQTEAVAVSLVAVDYGSDRVTLHLRVHNEATHAVLLDCHDVLLHLEDLDYAPVSEPVRTDIVAGGTKTVTIVFETGRPLLQPAVVSILGLQRDERHLPALDLQVPARPTAPDQSGTGP